MKPTVTALRREAAGCRRCDLWKLGTQTVFGEGALQKLMFVGEQPGDVEDRAGRPFVGPAGRLLRELLGEAEIAEKDERGQALQVAAVRKASLARQAELD